MKKTDKMEVAKRKKAQRVANTLRLLLEERIQSMEEVSQRDPTWMMSKQALMYYRHLLWTVMDACDIPMSTDEETP